MNKYRSIKLRLFLAALVTICIALTVAGFGLALLFERHVARGVDAELNVFLHRVIAHLEINDDGTLTIPEPPGRGGRQRATVPFSGYYWQLSENGSIANTSRSLWDQTIAPPPRPADTGEIQRYTAPGPNGTRLIVMFRQVLLDRPDGTAAKIGVSVATDDSAVTEPRRQFVRDMIPFLALLALFLIAAAVAQLVFGLRPLTAIRREVNAIRSGEQKRLSDAFPSEVQPLSEEINALLDAQDATLERARNRAADLAHGFRTPLTALVSDVRRLRDRGETEIAADIGQAVDIMNRHVAREMARARIRNAGATHAARLPVADALTPLIETLRRTPAGANIDWQLAIAGDLCIAMDRDDLMECMGNLLENAARYARTTVAVSGEADAGGVRLAIDDDGPGMSAAQREAILQRGRRLDESGGAGLGLAIVQDVIEAYGARLTLEQSRLGGLRAVVFLPTPATQG